MNSKKTSSYYSIAIDSELKAQIEEAIVLEDALKALDQNDYRWTVKHDRLRYLREEIGMMMIWEFQHMPF